MITHQNTTKNNDYDNAVNTNVPFNEYGIGTLDFMSASVIGGWIFVPNLEKPPVVEIYVDDEKIAEITPCLIRQDINKIYGAKIATGFTVSLPPFLALSKNSVLRAFAKKEKFELNVHENIHKYLSEVRGLIVTVAEKDHIIAKQIELVKSALYSNSDALRALNQDQKIKLLVDPGLGDIHIINGCEETTSELFRTWSLVQHLKELGFTPLIYSRNLVNYLRTPTLKACIYIRCAVDDELQQHIDFHKKNNVKLIADFDDLVFVPALITKIDGVRFLTESERRQYIVGMRGYRKLIEQCDLTLLSTQVLAKFAKNLTKNTFVLNNFPLKSARDSASKILKNKVVRDVTDQQCFVIGYFSGTLTHQKDFEVCANAVITFLRETPDAILLIVGHFDLSDFPNLISLNKQIKCHDFVPYHEMILMISQCSVVLAPLEIGNEFCESKSELKFFDAALVSVPTIASGTQVFKDCINVGENGYLAQSQMEWYLALKDLYLSPVLCETIGNNARKTIKNKFSSETQKNLLQEALGNLGLESRSIKKINQYSVFVSQVNNKSIIKKKKYTITSVAIIMPDIFIGSGGHRKLLLIGKELTNQGCACELVFLTDRSSIQIAETVENFGISASIFSIRAFGGVVPDAQLVIASSWNTVNIVSSLPTERTAYFVQDFEPYFSPMGSDYLQAYYSYQKGLKTICLGRWIKEKLHREFSITAHAVDFSIDRQVYFPRRAWVDRENIILFYARPDQPRRLYQLGLESILYLRSVLIGWKFITFGADIDETYEGIENIGKISNLDDIAELYSRAKLGISFSATNPSLVGIEMLAAGLPVIDVKTAVGSPDYEDCGGIEFVLPEHDSVISSVYILVGNETELERRSEAAEQWSLTLSTDEQFASRATNILLE